MYYLCTIINIIIMIIDYGLWLVVLKERGRQY